MVKGKDAEAKEEGLLVGLPGIECFKKKKATERDIIRRAMNSLHDSAFVPLAPDEDEKKPIIRKRKKIINW